MKVIARWIAGIALSGATAVSGARADDGDRLPLFESSAPLAIELRAPFAQLARDRDPAPEYRPAQLVIAGESGATLDATLRPRGKSRRDKSFCSFPPLSLRFPERPEHTAFAGQRKLKVVTHCRSAKGHLEYLAKERLLYQTLNLLTPHSFRVRPLSIRYVDTEKGRDFTKPGFLIESKRELRKRLGAVKHSVDALERRELAPEPAALVELFQYFAGNTDFSLLRGPEGDDCCHNVVPLMLNDRIVPVPYDFDSTGLVSPPYGAPLEQLGIRTLKQRLFRGFCRDDDSLSNAITRFLEARGAIEALFREEPALNDRTKARTLKYVAAFFDTLSDPAKRERQITGACRG